VMAFTCRTLPLPLVLGAAAGGGMVVALLVSAVHQRLKLPFLLSAIIVNGLFHSLTQYILGSSLKSFHMALLLSERGLLVVVGILLVGIFTLLLRSQLGYSLAIYGSNPLFFHHHPVSGRYVTLMGLALAHGCAGIGGFLFALSNGFVDLTMNVGVVLMSLTALILGKAVFPTHKPNSLVTLIGLTLYLCLQQALLYLGLNLKYFNAFQAVSILATLCLLKKKKTLSLDHLGV